MQSGWTLHWRCIRYSKLFPEIVTSSRGRVDKGCSQAQAGWGKQTTENGAMQWNWVPPCWPWGDKNCAERGVLVRQGHCRYQPFIHFMCIDASNFDVQFFRATVAHHIILVLSCMPQVQTEQCRSSVCWQSITELRERERESIVYRPTNLLSGTY